METSVGSITPDLAVKNQDITAEVSALMHYDDGGDYETFVGNDKNGNSVWEHINGSGQQGWKDSGLRNIDFDGLPEGSRVNVTEYPLTDAPYTYEIGNGTSQAGWGISSRVTLFTVTNQEGAIIWQGWYYSGKKSFGIKLTASC
jgi:hypothetical protein